MAKYRYPTRQAAEDEAKRLDQELQNWRAVMLDLQRKRVKWFKGGAYKIGVFRPRGARGGLVLVQWGRGDDMDVEVLTFDAWRARLQARVPLTKDGLDDHVVAAALAAEIWNYIRKELQAETRASLKEEL